MVEHLLVAQMTRVQFSLATPLGVFVLESLPVSPKFRA